MKTILIADDEPDVLKVLRFRLTKRGYNVLTAVNGKEALDLAREKRPDLLIVDYRMPVMDGEELCRKLKDDDELKRIPVIFITAAAESISDQQWNSIPADDYIIKPFEPEDLLEKVRRFAG